jgi:hypothetical protein
MASHAFQVLVTDDDLHTSLTAIRAALIDDGRFAFETRNPLARPWGTKREAFEPVVAIHVADFG